ncbi:MAG: RNA polymerase sigma-70 factor [Bacteroidales bacterium]|nr:RNA polymerase sigma-70 factor [Bacteroidales bacterium]MCF8334279.1 RNA polymerase sigma-70 factor [Bacteroidales bacterium]
MERKESGYRIGLKEEDKQLIERLRKGEEQAFEKLFTQYYETLCVFALHYLPDEDAAKDLVQEMFFKIWEKRATFFITTSLESYLFRSVHNQAINYLNHEKIKKTYKDKILDGFKRKLYNDDVAYNEVDLRNAVNQSVESLPEKRKRIFKLSRYDGLKYSEIASKMDISVKTVEAQMTQAIKSLRDKLKDYRK